MAAFASATGVLQVAGVGAELCKALWKAGNDVRNGSKDLADIATEVKNVSSALGGLGQVLQQDDAEREHTATLTNEARSALEECLQDCKSAFAELDQALQSARKSFGYGGISMSAKGKWPLKKGSTQALVSKLRGLTNLVSLMVQILVYARKRASDAASAEDRMRIERLVRSNEELVHRLTASIQTTTMDDPLAADPIAINRSVAAAPTASTPVGFGPADTVLPALSNQFPPAPNVFTVIQQSPPGDEDITQKFEACLQAVGRLATSLDAALSTWRANKLYRTELIFSGYAEVTSVVGSLTPGEDYSPRGSRSFRRGSPPVNGDRKYCCDLSPKCKVITFDRKCEWR
ncbi:hypothetical protein LTR65_002299 [Meristemomyces frigidus]